MSDFSERINSGNKYVTIAGGRGNGTTHSLIRIAYEQGRADEIDDYTEWLRKAHANFDEDYAEDIKSDYLDWLKEQGR